MKSIKIAAALFSTLAVGTSAFAAYGPTGTLTISGVVAVVNELEVTATANATALNITGGETDKLVATVSEHSNNLNGYKIKMKSANGGQLVNTANSSVKTAYKLGYNGATKVTLSTGDTDMKTVNALTGLTTVSSNVNVDVTALATAAAGTYSDTITVSIVAN